MHLSFKPDLRFKIVELNSVVQNLHTGVKQLQDCQILCAGNTQMDFFWVLIFTFLHCLW